MNIHLVQVSYSSCVRNVFERITCDLTFCGLICRCIAISCFYYSGWSSHRRIYRTCVVVESTDPDEPILALIHLNLHRLGSWERNAEIWTSLCLSTCCYFEGVLVDWVSFDWESSRWSCKCHLCSRSCAWLNCDWIAVNWAFYWLWSRKVVGTCSLYICGRSNCTQFNWICCYRRPSNERKTRSTSNYTQSKFITVLFPCPFLFAFNKIIGIAHFDLDIEIVVHYCLIIS